MFSTMQLVKSSQTPLYLQLANGLAYFIENGQLCPGTKLPSIRSLAKELKINRDTVVSAYKILGQKGLTYGQTGSGTYVSTSSPAIQPNPSSMESFSFHNKNLINFSTTVLSANSCPIEIFESISSHLILKEGWQVFYDNDGEKRQLLLQEVCNYLKYNGLQSTLPQIRIIKDIAQILQSLPKLTARPGICIESPCKNFSIFQQHGFKAFEVPLESDGMNMEILEELLKNRNIQYIYVMPYLQNPTGICYSIQKRLRLIGLAKKYNVYIIEEDSYGDLLRKDLPYEPLYASSSNNHVIYIKNFSLLYLPKLLYSFVILPRPLKDMKTNCLPHSFIDSLFYQYLRQGIWKQSKLFLINHYHMKYQKLLALIDTYLTPYVSYTNSWGGIYLWLTVHSPYITVKDLCDALVSCHVLVSPGALFYSHKLDRPYIRISISQVNVSQIERGIKEMANLLHQKKLP